jgi:hypothetical protein
MSRELILDEGAEGRSNGLVDRYVDPVVAQLVDAAWARSRLTRNGVRGTGISADSIVEQVGTAISAWTDDIANRTRAANEQMGNAHPELVERTPTSIDELMKTSGLDDADSELRQLIFNPILRFAPLMVLGALAHSRDDLIIHNLELALLVDRRIEHRNELPYVWPRSPLGARAQALLLTATMTIAGHQAHIPVGLSPLSRPHASAFDSYETSFTVAARRLLADADQAGKRLRQTGHLDGAATIASLPLIVRGPIEFGYPRVKTSRHNGKLTHQLTPGIAARFAKAITDGWPSAALECTDRPSGGREAARGALLVRTRSGVSARRDHRDLTAAAEQLNVLDSRDPKAEEIYLRLRLEDVTLSAQAESRLTQWVMAPTAVLAGMNRERIPVLPLLGLPRADGPCSVWLVTGDRRSNTLAAVEHRLASKVNNAYEECVELRYRRRACTTLLLNAGVKPALRTGVESAHMVANLIYVLLALGT